MQYLIQHLIPYISLLGLFLPLLILFYNKGFKSVNRFLAGFLFFSSLYLLESLTFFYSTSRPWAAFFTMSHDFIFYLVGPLSFFYVRGMLRDNARLGKKDWLQFLPFVLSFIGSIPYYFSSWEYKLMIADNILSNEWDIAQFELNFIFHHKVDQVFNMLHMYFYACSLWYLIWKYKRDANSRIYHVPQFKLIRNWLFLFTIIITVITINFSVTVIDILVYDEKSLFLQKAVIPLFCSSIIYVGMNMIIMFFPHIMYGLPIEVKNVVAPMPEDGIEVGTSLPHPQPKPETISDEMIEEDEKITPQLFSEAYISAIEATLNTCINKALYLQQDFRLVTISSISAFPAHHLTYYFNTIIGISFSEWRNKLRIEYAVKLLQQGDYKNQTLEAIANKAGFATQNTFIRTFKRIIGKTPSEYLKENA
jgi:AraC-like DNA-binding protein